MKYSAGPISYHSFVQQPASQPVPTRQYHQCPSLIAVINLCSSSAFRPSVPDRKLATKQNKTCSNSQPLRRSWPLPLAHHLLLLFCIRSAELSETSTDFLGIGPFVRTLAPVHFAFCKLQPPHARSNSAPIFFFLNNLKNYYETSEW